MVVVKPNYMKHEHEHEHEIKPKNNKQASCCSTDEEEIHSDDDGHDHSNSNQTPLQMFLPPIISFILLLIAIGLLQLWGRFLLVNIQKALP